MLEPTFSDTTPAAWSAASAATSLDGSDESAVTALYRVAIGPVNTAYYLRAFARFEAADRAGPSWNWVACLCTLNWMAFRQLWWAALAYAGAAAGAALLVIGLGRLVFQTSATQELWLGLALGVLALLVPGVWGNALMYMQCRKRTDHALASTATLSDASVMLNRQASSRQRLAWLALANAVFAGAAIGVWIAFAPTQPAPAATLAAPVVPVVPVPPESASAPVAPPPAIASAAASSPAPTFEATARIPAGAPSSAAATPTAPAYPADAARAKTRAIATQRFLINVGLFAQHANARNTHAKLVAAGLPALTQELDTAKGKLTRVRVGPFETRQAAEAAVKQIHALKLDAVLLQQ